MSVSYDPVDVDDEFDPEGEGAQPGDEFELEPEAGDEGLDAAPQDDEPTIEEQARALGWRPLEEFQGEPRLWRDAEAFLQHGYTDPRVLRENNQKLTQKVARTERQLGEARGEIAELKTQVSQLLGIAQRQEKGQFDQRRSALVARRREAVADGDQSAFDQVERELEALDTERAAPTTDPAPAAPTFHPAITDFIAENSWWKEDLDLQRAMNAHYDIVMHTRKDLDIEDQLALAKKRLMADFPDKFGGTDLPATPPRRAGAPPPRRPGATGVLRPSGGAGGPAPRRRGEVTGWDTIADPTERAQAKDAFARDKRADPGLTEAEYLTIYHDPHADPLELRRQRKP